MISWFSETVLFGNPLWLWLVAIAVALFTFVALLLVKNAVGRRLKMLSGKTSNGFDDLLVQLVDRFSPLLVLAIAAAAAASLLDIGSRGETLIGKIVVLAVVYQGAAWIWLCSTRVLERILRRYRGDDPSSIATLNLVQFGVRVLIGTIALLIVLENFGIDVTALVTGLGIGGVAVALAVQNILGDLFASLSIIFDKPFEVGDFIIVDSSLGTVEKIGLKTTRVRSLSGEQLIFSNTDLLTSRIQNYKRMNTRRAVFTFRVKFGTELEKLKRIPEVVRELIEQHSDLRFDRCHMKEFGESCLVFETVYYVESPSYNVYMDRQQAVNFGILQHFEQERIPVGLPMRTVIFPKQDGGANGVEG